LGSSFGTALVGSVLVAAASLAGGRSYALALTVLAVIALIGLALAVFLPRQQAEAANGNGRPVAPQRPAAARH